MGLSCAGHCRLCHHVCQPIREESATKLIEHRRAQEISSLIDTLNHCRILPDVHDDASHAIHRVKSEQCGWHKEQRAHTELVEEKLRQLLPELGGGARPLAE